MIEGEEVAVVGEEVEPLGKSGGRLRKALFAFFELFFVDVEVEGGVVELVEGRVVEDSRAEGASTAFLLLEIAAAIHERLLRFRGGGDPVVCRIRRETDEPPAPERHERLVERDLHLRKLFGARKAPRDEFADRFDVGVVRQHVTKKTPGKGAATAKFGGRRVLKSDKLLFRPLRLRRIALRKFFLALTAFR